MASGSSQCGIFNNVGLFELAVKGRGTIVILSTTGIGTIFIFWWKGCNISLDKYNEDGFGVLQTTQSVYNFGVNLLCPLFHRLCVFECFRVWMCIKFEYHKMVNYLSF